MDADPPTPTLETPPKAEETDADKIKEAGNVAFKARKFDDAIALYTKAIGEVYYHNPNSLGRR